MSQIWWSYMSIHRKNLKNSTSWQVQWRDQTGEQVAQRFRTKKDAEAFEAQLKLNKYQGLLPSREGTKVTFGDYAMRWRELKETAANGQKVSRPRTSKRRDEILRLHLIPEFGDHTLASITTGRINDLVNMWQKIGLKPRTIRNHIYVLRPILELAVNEQLITRNPVDGVQMPKLGEVERHILEPEMVMRLIAEVPDEHKALVVTGFMTGMRFDELVNLQLSDINFEKKTVNVKVSKTRAGIRTIPLTDEETEFLKRHILDTRSEAGPDDFLFVSSAQFQRKINHSNFMKRVFKPAAHRAGVPDVTPHDMRRTHATHLAESDIPQTTLHVRMGHEHLSTTQQYYIFPTDLGQSKAAGVVSEILKLPLSDIDEQP